MTLETILSLCVLGVNWNNLLSNFLQKYTTSVWLTKKVNTVLCTYIIKSLYGIMIEDLLFDKKIMKELKLINFKINPYDPYVSNNIVHVDQIIVSWHFDQKTFTPQYQYC